MISVRSPLSIVALVAIATTFATLASAHDHHHDHDGFSWWAAPNGKSVTENLHDCLCWNSTTNSWCQDSSDSHRGFWRPSCSRVLVANTWWWIPVILWAIYLVLMPLCMAAFRLCCNCCGGRTPSYGCCCPISNGVLSPDPKWVRPYSRCATWTAKILALIFAITILTLSIHSFVDNDNVSGSVRSSVKGAQDFLLPQLPFVRAADMTRYPNANGQGSVTFGRPSWQPVTAYNMINRAQTFNPTLQSIADDLPKIEKYDKSNRASPINALVALPLIITVIVTILAFCNVRSWPISISAGLVSFLTLGVVLLASAVGTAGAGFSLVCDNYQHIRNFAVDTLKGNGFCDVSELADAINNTQIGFARHVCQDMGLAAMITPQGNITKYSFCDERVGGMLSMSWINAQVPQGFNWAGHTFSYDATYSGSFSGDAKNAHVNLNSFEWLVESANFAPIYDANGFNQSIARCMSNKTCPQYNKWHSLSSQVDIVFSGLTFIYRANNKCAWATTAFDRVVLPNMCGVSQYEDESHNSLSHRTNALSGHLFGFAIVCTLVFWVWMYGSKRFTKGASAEEMLEHHQMQRNLRTNTHQLNVSAPVPLAEPHGTYGDGLNGPRPQPPVPEVVATSIPKQPATDAVANTIEAPLLLQHDDAVHPTGSVNSRSEMDVETPVKEAAPQPM